MLETPIRGVMLDSARLIEKPQVYDDLIPLLGEWGYNLLLWHFIDDQGCSMVFPRRPELSSLHAMRPPRMRQIIELARESGLSVVPEIECFGHTGRILALPRYQHLRDGAEGKAFGAMCPFHKDARSLLKDLLADAADMFDSPYIHVGMDEVGFGQHPLSQKLLRKAKKWELFAEHINWLHKVVTGRGRRMMMWGDHLFHEFASDHARLDHEAFSEKILDRIPKDIIICDWHYQPAVPTSGLDHFLKKGFQVLCCPAVSAAGMLNHPRQWNIDNLRNFAAIAAEREGKGVIGSIATVWIPLRWYPGTVLSTTALAAACQLAGGREPAEFFPRFAHRTFGTEGNATSDIATALILMHRISPQREILRAAMPVTQGEVEQISAERMRELAKCQKGAAEALRLLNKSRPAVRYLRDYFDDLIFAADCLATVSATPVKLRAIDKMRNTSQKRKAHVALSDTIALLQQKSLQRWNLCRYDNDPKRDGKNSRYQMYDSLSQRLYAHSRFMSRLVSRTPPVQLAPGARPKRRLKWRPAKWYFG